MEKKLWSHVTRATLPPPRVHVVTTVVITVAATLGSDAVAGVAAITRPWWTKTRNKPTTSNLGQQERTLCYSK